MNKYLIKYLVHTTTDELSKKCNYFFKEANELALEECRRKGNNHFASLKCTSSFLAPIEEANVCMVKDLAECYSVISELSDHTMGTTEPIVAAIFGAKIIEKNFILDRSVSGSDAAFFMNKSSLQLW